jgi:hypothetical protein
MSSLTKSLSDKKHVRVLTPHLKQFTLGSRSFCEAFENLQAATEALRAFLKALDEKGDPCAGAVTILVSIL